MKIGALTVVAFGWVVVAELAATVDRPDKRQDAAREAIPHLQGCWQLTAVKVNARDPARAILKAYLVHPYMEIKGKQFVALDKDGQTSLTFRVHGAKSPRAIDFFPEGSTSGPVLQCIYALRGGRLTLCQATDGKGRPAGFNSRTGRETITLIWKRTQP
jgi:uncharacterized protein (TIGR03067 family)